MIHLTYDRHVLYPAIDREVQMLLLRDLHKE